MTSRHYAFFRQHRAQFSEDIYAFELWRYVAVQIWRVKELFVPGIVASTIKWYFYRLLMLKGLFSPTSHNGIYSASHKVTKGAFIYIT